MSKTEEEVIKTRHETLPTVDENLTCSKLLDGKCTIYEDRPLICRFWGMVEGLPCHFGCTPVGGRLPDSEAIKILRKVGEL